VSIFIGLMILSLACFGIVFSLVGVSEEIRLLRETIEWKGLRK